MTTVAGAVELSAVMAELRRTRPVFHSEADFQHAFAWAVRTLDNTVNVRLEVPQAAGERLDLLCFGSRGSTAIELKHFTAVWHGADPAAGEQFRLRGHEATDLARLHFVSDIARLERFCGQGTAGTTLPEGTTGLAIMLTNDHRLWTPSPRRLTNDQRFRIHEGQTLAGTLRWGSEPVFFERHERTLSGSYTLRWHDHASLGGRNGEFRWLGVAVAAAPDRDDVTGVGVPAGAPSSEVEQASVL